VTFTLNLMRQIRGVLKVRILGSLLIACIGFIHCQKQSQNKNLLHVGILSSFASFGEIADGFKAGMAELGYREGENIVYDMQVGHANPEEERRAADKFVADRLDLIFSFPTEAAVVAKAATQNTNIPVVFALAGIEGNNLVESIPRPGGNITGVRYRGPDNTVKRFEILHELVPGIKKLYVTYDIDYPTNEAALEALRPVVASLGITLIESRVKTAEEIKADLQARSASGDIGIDAILIMPDLISQSQEGFGAIVKFANAHRIPIGGGALFTADLGAAFSYSEDLSEIGTQAASLADKIFKGTPAGTIMVVTPANYLRLNYKVIQELGLTVREGLLNRASEIIR
jgi:putative ABC transport system substrate-binding protein